MGYPLINGAPLNDSGQGGLSLQGLDLVTGGGATVVLSPTVGSSAPLELGPVAVKATLYPSGLDLVTTTTHTARFDALIRHAGIDLVSKGAATAFATYAVQSASPLEFGAAKAQLGVDQAITPDGRDLVRAATVMALGGQPLPIVYVEAGSAKPLEFGAPAMACGGLAVEAASANPLALGGSTIRQVFTAGGAFVFEIGMPNTAAVVRPTSASPLELGTASVVAQVSATGLDLVHEGGAVARRAAVVVFVGEAYVLEFGESEPFERYAIARAAFPVAMGMPSIQRGTTC